MKISVIIPVYNEENTLEQVLQNVTQLNIPKVSLEIIAVDDGSKDATPKILDKYSQNYKNMTVYKNRFNRGKGAAVIKGIKKAKGDILVIQDADLEYNPKDIPRLVAPLMAEKAQVVYGTRLKMKPVLFGKNRTPLLLHFFGNKMLSLITSVLYGSSVSDMETGYKAFHKGVINGMKLKARSFDFEPEITAKILKKHIKIHEIKIKTNPRGYDEGKKLNTFRDGTIALWTLLKYKFVD